jgi:uncharacterized SAM-binding protein YcdF (DUF218 family)
VPRLARLACLTAAGLVLVVVLPKAGAALVIYAPVDNPDAIVMLASHEWERLPAAAAAARQHPAARFILTVPRSPSPANCFRCGERIEWLSREGIGPNRIQELRGVVNTYGEARAVAAYVRSRGLRRVLVVTSPYHTRRSLQTFRRVLAGSDVEVGVLPSSSTSTATPSTWWRHDLDRAYVLYEWAAIGAYAVRHGVPPF